jgi:hypothetical protein
VNVHETAAAVGAAIEQNTPQLVARVREATVRVSVLDLEQTQRVLGEAAAHVRRAEARQRWTFLAGVALGVIVATLAWLLGASL